MKVGPNVIARFSGVGKIYQSHGRTTVALDEFNLEVRRGELLVLMGPSGCGKTTALNILAGHDFSTSGATTFEDESVNGPDRSRVMAFQSDTLYPWRTTEENVLYGIESECVSRLGGLRRVATEMALLIPLLRKWAIGHLLGPAKIQEARKWLAAVGLGEFGSSLPRELSGGMRKRVELARAYAAGPKMLLLDESFDSLDSLTREEMHLVLEGLWKRTGCTIVVSTHDPREAVALADRIVILTSRPGTVHSIVPVDLPRPRDVSVLQSQDFFLQVNNVANLVRAAARVCTTIQDIAAEVAAR